MTEQPGASPRTITEHVAVTVARLRQEQRISMLELERRLAEVGEPIPRLGLGRLEKGERKVSAEEIVALARVFNVPPLLLMFPFDATEARTQILPGVVVDTRAAAKWFAGRGPFGDEPGSAGRAAIRLFDEHDRLLEDAGYLDTEFRLFPAAYDDPEKHLAERKLRKAVRDLRYVRAQMRERRLTPPPLDEQMAYVDDDGEFVPVADGQVRVFAERDQSGRVRPVDFSDRDE